jgi:hypothetical protein
MNSDFLLEGLRIPTLPPDFLTDNSTAADLGFSASAETSDGYDFSMPAYNPLLD